MLHFEGQWQTVEKILPCSVKQNVKMSAEIVGEGLRGGLEETRRFKRAVGENEQGLTDNILEVGQQPEEQPRTQPKYKEEKSVES